MNAIANSPDETETEDSPITNPAPIDELALLKERAKTLGIQISGNIGLDTLRARIKDHMEGNTTPPEAQTAKAASSRPVARELTKAEIEQKVRTDLHRDKMKLVRCRIYNLNPAKRDLQGEIITVANRYLGTVRKMIPFGEATDGGYHIEQVLYEHLKKRKFLQIRTKKVQGKIEVSTRMVPEYSIEVLPSLSAAELQELAVKQAAAERLSHE